MLAANDLGDGSKASPAVRTGGCTSRGRALVVVRRAKGQVKRHSVAVFFSFANFGQSRL